VIFRIPICRRNWSVDASIILADLNVQRAVKVLNKRNGNNLRPLRNLYANVRIIYVFFHIEFRKEKYNFINYENL